MSFWSLKRGSGEIVVLLAFSITCRGRAGREGYGRFENL